MKARAILALAALAAFPTTAQDLPAQPDILPGVVMTMAIVDELRSQCKVAFPQLAPTIDGAYREWPLAKTTIAITVNGRPYQSPAIARVIADIRIQFASGNDAKNRGECEGFKARLEELARRMPKEAIAPFVAPPPEAGRQ